MSVALWLMLLRARLKNLPHTSIAMLLQLNEGGAQIGTIPAFSPQICARELREITPIPLIDLLDAIVAEIDRQKVRRLSIFGTRVTMETKLFGKLDELDIVTPTPRETDTLSGIYQRIVEGEGASPDEYATLRALAHALDERGQLDAILLAGTDLTFVFTPDNTDSLHLDGARIHIDAIMERLAPK